MGAVVQVNDNRHGKAALAQTSFGGFVPKGGSSNDSGVLEIIVPDAQASVRWVKHGYPSSLAKWHHHPHIENSSDSGRYRIDDGGQCRCSV